jgi:calcium-dependent protein kinase
MGICSAISKKKEINITQITQSQQPQNQQHSNPITSQKEIPKNDEIIKPNTIQNNERDEIQVNIDKQALIHKNEDSVENHYTIVGKSLGEGSFGKVYKVKHNKTGTVRAMKVISKVNSNNDKEIENEINILKTIDHQKVVKIFEFFISEKNYYIITEYCQEGELFSDITSDSHKNKPYTEEAAAYIMYQIFSALFYCHSRNIVHRDLKPENMLLERKDKNDNHDIKVIDFGTAKIFDKDKLENRLTGSSYYIAPEVIFGRYNEKCDLWSCGVILYILLTGLPPFFGKNEEEIFEKIKIGKYDLTSVHWRIVSKEVKDLVKGLLNYNPKVRLGAEQALNHIWFLKFQTKQQANLISDEKIKNCVKNIQNYKAAYVLQQAALAFLVHNSTHLPEIQDAYRLFNLIDVNGDGVIIKEEFFKGLKKYWNKDEDEIAEEVEKIFKKIDADNNGYVEYEEFCRAAIDKSKFLKDDILKMAFRFFDKDGSGEITMLEIKSFFFKDISSDKEEEIMKLIVKEVDVNGDGKISFNEFKTVMRDILVK